MISLKAYWMGRDIEFPPTLKMQSNANDLLERVEDFFYDLGIELHDEDVSSGYRPDKYNTAAGGSRNSCHLDGSALDVKDPKGLRLKKLLEKGEPALKTLLAKHGLYMEHYSRTKTWLHFQTRATINRIFMP
jgi:hypothetical protein